VLTAYSPLAREKALGNPVIKEIADKHRKTPAQITLKWELKKDVVVIPKAASPAHQEENINIFDFNLDDEDIRRIDNMGEFERLVSLDTP
jgi:diketogulonate reductase-like aldo/keto reductase